MSMVPIEDSVPAALLAGSGWREDGRWILVPAFDFTVAARLPEDVLPALAKVEAFCDQGLHAFGFAAYEAAGAFGLPVLPTQATQPLLWFGFCRKETLRLVDLAEWPEPALEPRLASVQLRTDPVLYEGVIESIKEHIAAGNTYQVNYTLRAGVHCPDPPFPWFLHLFRSQPVPYAAYLQNEFGTVLSLSPELFLKRRGNTLLSRPMKGTRGRGRTSAEDRERKRDLAASAKDRAENVMIVDMVRHDLGKICRYGSVRAESLFEIEKYRTLFQMTGTVCGDLRDGVGLSDIFAAAFPAASITGAPKHRTMEIIAEHEDNPRGVYCGGIGVVEPTGDFVFNVAIRTLAGRPPEYVLGVGGGIVWDSIPSSEYEEIETKMGFIRKPIPPFQLIETLRLREDGTYSFLDEHLERLRDSAEYWDFYLQEETVRAELETFARQADRTPAAVRLLLSPSGCVSLECRAVTVPPESVRVVISNHRVDSSDPFLFHKTTRRDLYNRERERAVQSGFFEVMFVNERGLVTEGTITSLMVRLGDSWFTPPLADGLLPGVWRQSCLTAYPARERSLTAEELLSAEEVRIGNSVMGAVRVKEMYTRNEKESGPKAAPPRRSE